MDSGIHRASPAQTRDAQGPHTWTTMADPEGNEFCVS